MKRQNGFTLIELVMVIVILGVLAAVAMPKFIDLKDEAQKASVRGVAGAASSAAAINYAGCVLVSHAAGAKCVQVATCDSVKGALSGGTWPAAGGTDKFVALATGTDLTASATNNGVSNNCELRLTNTAATTVYATASFVVIGAGTP